MKTLREDKINFETVIGMRCINHFAKRIWIFSKCTVSAYEQTYKQYKKRFLLLMH